MHTKIIVGAGKSSFFKPIKIINELIEGWIPANPNILKEIRQKLRSKSYKTTKEVLLESRNDVALYTYLISSVEPKKGKSNLEILSETPLAKLESVLPIASSTISKYDISKLLDPQAQNIQMLIISSVTAQLLALNNGSDPEQAYLTSLLRVMGLTMSAWNFQHIYTKASQVTDDICELDNIMEKKLEFSPISTFIRVTGNWNLPLEVYYAAVSGNSFSKLDDIRAELENKLDKPDKQKVRDLSESCRIAEQLAIATVTSAGRGSDELWEKACQKVTEVLGHEGLEDIEERVNGVWKNYAPLFSGWYDDIFSKDGRIKRYSSDYGKKYFASNKYIQQCAPEIQQAFSELYRKMTDAEAALGAFHSLITDLVPGSGFMEGGIFIADQTTMEIKQLMTLGRAARKDYKPAYMQNRSQDLDPIVKSLMSGTIVKGRVSLDNRDVLYVSGATGVPPNQLIIYLETSHLPYLNGELDATLCFRAVQQFILDSFMNS